MSGERAETDVQVTRSWRGVPPDSVAHDGQLPTWREAAGFTSEGARSLLTTYYGADWILEVQTTTVSAWTRVTPPEGRCRECGKPAVGDEFEASGLCQLCLNGSLSTSVTSPGSGDTPTEEADR